MRKLNVRSWYGYLTIVAGVLGLVAPAVAQQRAVVLDVDLKPLIARDASVPSRFAVDLPHPVSAASATGWSGTTVRTWRYAVQVPGAVSMSFHAAPVVLPSSAVLTVDAGGARYVYRAGDVRNGELWSRIARGDTLSLELSVAATDQSAVRFEMLSLQAGYRGFGHGARNHPFYDSLRKQPMGATASCTENFECDVDSANTGPGQATVALVIGNTAQCSGVLLNDVPGDAKPYVLTARHCENGDPNGGSPSAASTITVYWDAVTPCGAPLGTIYDPGIVTQYGAVTVVEQQDAWLIKLNQAPAVTDAYFAGWDATGAVFVGGYTAHHELGGRRQYVSWFGQAFYQSVPPATLGVGFTSTFWETVNQLGSAGPGASGSGVFDGNNHLVGVLVRGLEQSSQPDAPGVCPQSPPPEPSASTATIFSTALSGIYSSTADPKSTTGQTTLQTVLDPANTGTLVVDGVPAPLSASLQSSNTEPNAGSPVTLTWSTPTGSTCTAAGGIAGDGWGGAVAASGTQTVVEFVGGGVTYSISCTNGNQRSIGQVTVNWIAVPGYEFIYATPQSMQLGTPAQLQWYGNLQSCTATGGAAGDGWSGPLPVSGSQSVTEASLGTYTYGITCTGGGSTASSSIDVTVYGPSSTVHADAVSLQLGQSVMLWALGYGTSCVAGGGTPGDGWAGYSGDGTPVAVTETVAGTYTFTFACTSGSQTATGQAVVTFSSSPAAVTMSASAPTGTIYSGIGSGTIVTLSFDSNVRPCSLSAVGPVSSGPTSMITVHGTYSAQSLVIGPFTYTMTCGTGSNTAQASVPVSWTGIPQATVYSPSSSGYVGVATPITWSTNILPCTTSGGTAGDGWSVTAGSTSGTALVTDAAGSYTYTLTCGSGAQTAQASTTITFAAVTPTMTLTASTATAQVGGPYVQVHWTSNTLGCIATGGGSGDAWAGPQAPNGSPTITEVAPGTYTYGLTCSIGSQSTQSQFMVTFAPAAPPTLSANATTATLGQAVLLNWTLTTPQTCTLSGGAFGDGWAQTIPLAGNMGRYVTETTAGTYTYSISCGGSAVVSVSVTFSAPQSAPLPPLPPTAQLVASASTVAAGQPVTLTWQSTGASQCTASGGVSGDGWSGTLAPNGSLPITETSAASVQYSVNCAGAGVPASAEVTVTVMPAPTASITSSASSVTAGVGFTLNWQTSGVTSCDASGGISGDGWTGAEPSNGSAPVTESAAGSDVYVLTCQTAGAPVVSQVTVTVTAKPASGGGGGGGGGAFNAFGLAALAAIRVLRRLRARGAAELPA